MYRIPVGLCLNSELLGMGKHGRNELTFVFLKSWFRYMEYDGSISGLLVTVFRVLDDVVAIFRILRNNFGIFRAFRQ